MWAGSWIVFNLVFGVLMGIYHQGGIVPTQVYLSHQADATHAVWWKTYSPPIWLLNGKNEVLQSHDMMGMKGNFMIRELEQLATCHGSSGPQNGTYLVAPMSATFLDEYISESAGTDTGTSRLYFEQVWQYRQHLNLDDLEFGDDGVWPTLRRVIGRRGLATWKVTKDCNSYLNVTINST
jgi:phosphatidylinositol glycan class Z